MFERAVGRGCFFHLTGDGETLLPEDVVPLIHGLLKEGHWVNVVTNGTLTGRIHELIDLAEKDGLLERLTLSVSFHFLELEKHNMLEAFAENVNYVKEKNGGGINLTMVASEEYLEASDRIHKFCDEKGLSFATNMVREYNMNGDVGGIKSKYGKEEYLRIVSETFPSYNIARDNGGLKIDSHMFCYAGSWLFCLDFATGVYAQCSMNMDYTYNFFEHLDKKPLLEPVGTGCKAEYCWCRWAQRFNLIPNECNYNDNIEEIHSAREFQNLSWEALKTRYTNLAKVNREYTEWEKAENEKRRIEFEYFKKKVHLLAFDFKEEKYEEFIEGAQKLLENDLEPRFQHVVQLVVWYGYALLRSGRTEEALVLESCYEDLNYNADYCFVMGLIYMKNGNIEDAIRLFGEAMEKYCVLEEGTNTYLPRYNLGVIYECMGNLAKARKLYMDCGNYESAKNRLHEMA